MRRLFTNHFSNKLIPNLEAVNLFEYFLISSVSSLLFIRAFLTLTGYPQIGGEGLHIAHMLWGGALMFVSIAIFISFINAQSKAFASVLGGIGFGTFIDELGKFVTSDNDYFYQPTIAIIYVVFIIMFLVIRWLSSYAKYSAKTYLANAIEGLREIVISDLDANEKRLALKYLKLSDQSDPVVKQLYSMLQVAQAKKATPSIAAKIRHEVFQWYKDALNTKFVSRGLFWFFVLVSFLNFIVSLVSIILKTNLTFADTGTIISNIIIGILVLQGARYFFKNRRLESYVYLQRASLVAIFLQQFFLFLQNQLSSLTTLGVYISVYLILKFSVEAEKSYSN